MSASTDPASFKPLALHLGREHVDAVESLLATRRTMRFDGELGLTAWTKLSSGLSDRVAAASLSRREETLREARIRLRSPVPGEASSGAFVVGCLSDDASRGVATLAGSRRDPSPVLAGLRVAAASRTESGSIESWMDVDVWSAAGLLPAERAIARMRDGDLRGAFRAWARGTEAPAAVENDLARAAIADGADASTALYALGRVLQRRFPEWLKRHPEAARHGRAEIALAVFGDATTARAIALRGHAGIRALGWLGVPSSLGSLVPMLERGCPDPLLRSVASALFIVSGAWFVVGGVPSLRAKGPVEGDPDAARAWLRHIAPDAALARHHLGVPIAETWALEGAKGARADEPMSRRWLRAQLGLADAPTSRELPDALLGEAVSPRLLPTDLSFLPPPPWTPVA